VIHMKMSRGLYRNIQHSAAESSHEKLLGLSRTGIVEEVSRKADR